MYNFDHSDFFEFICHMPRQIKEAPGLVESVSFENLSNKYEEIVLTGMGGSAISGDLLAAYLDDQINIPFIVNRNYHLPHFVGKKSLVIACSYSGNTEETLSATREALARESDIIALASGGELQEIAAINNLPFIKIPEGFPPRQALGYLFFALLHTFQKLEIAVVSSGEIDETIHLLQDLCKKMEPGKTHGHNFCNHIAQKLYKTTPLIYAASELLSPVTVRWRNQLNENAKTLAFTNIFPELNHNEIMGWEGQKDVLSNFSLVLLRDRSETPRNRKRLEITRDMLRNCDCPIVEVFGEGQSRLARMFSQIYIGDWVSYYLAVLYGKDPIKIDSIQKLKEQLSQFE